MLARGGNPKTDYAAGESVNVLVNEMADEGRKMTLSLVGVTGGGGGGGGGGQR